MPNSSTYIYDWQAEHGQDPFAQYTDKVEERRELESLIQPFIDAAVNHPSDPLEPNKQLLDLANHLKEKYSPGVVYAFYRIVSLPDPFTMEKLRLMRIEREAEEAAAKAELLRLTPEERTARIFKSHKGHWTWHDDDCQCARYFDDSYCNRNGYIWSCCGQMSESGMCYSTS